MTELEAAEKAGERVWVMGHMPLGTSDAFHDQSQYFGTFQILAIPFSNHWLQQIKSFNVSTLLSLQSSTAIHITMNLRLLTPHQQHPLQKLLLWFRTLLQLLHRHLEIQHSESIAWIQWLSQFWIIQSITPTCHLQHTNLVQFGRSSTAWKRPTVLYWLLLTPIPLPSSLQHSGTT